MIKKIFILIVLLFIIGELFARYVLGLGNSILYISDKDYEYIEAPNQDIYRFHNHIFLNEYSMKSLPLNKSDRNILVFGDSVLNGGALTDFNNLATTIVEKELRKTDENIRILNISAGSWGPDNAFEYLKKYGNFNTKKIILIFSSHDAHDNITHEEVVGILPSYPEKQPCCALVDGFERYFIPKIISFFESKKEIEMFSKINKIDYNNTFNSGFQNFVSYTKKYNIELMVILHPDKKELMNNDYNSNGYEIINFLKNNNIKCILELQNVKLEYFRDAIHYNKQGQTFLSTELYSLIYKD